MLKSIGCECLEMMLVFYFEGPSVVCSVGAPTPWEAFGRKNRRSVRKYVVLEKKLLIEYKENVFGWVNRCEGAICHGNQRYAWLIVCRLLYECVDGNSWNAAHAHEPQLVSTASCEGPSGFPR